MRLTKRQLGSARAEGQVGAGHYLDIFSLLCILKVVVDRRMGSVMDRTVSKLAVAALAAAAAKPSFTLPGR
jgi:hypothetical protein